LCGSATAWMIKNIVKGKGGIHNRLHQTIYLEPFTLKQTQQMLDYMKFGTTPEQTISLYMILGGVPYYLSLLDQNKSITQNIDDLLFTPSGKLYKEFEELFSSLYDNPKNHINIINILSKKLKGYTRREIAEEYKNDDGGALTEAIEDLRLSGFISSHRPYNQTAKDIVYRLSDPFVLFYLKFLNKKVRPDSYSKITDTAPYKTWCGYAFENICLAHINSIKRAMSITKTDANINTFYYKGDKIEKGVQIDMLIDRVDGVINICEIKHYANPILLDQKAVKQIEEQINNFKALVAPKKTVQYTYIALNGLTKNQYSKGVVNSVVAGKDLFLK
jgi:uncharacterized protein